MTAEDLLNFPGLSDHERRIVDMRIRQGLRTNVIAKRLGITISSVNASMCVAKQRAQGKRPVARTRSATNTRLYAMDADSFPRQVAYVRSIANANDPTHQQRYLNGIAIVWGRAWADRVEEAANA